MDNNIYTPQTPHESEKDKKSMYVVIGTWALVIIAVAIMFTAIVTVKSQLAENKQAIYENSKAIIELQACAEGTAETCTIHSKQD